MRLFVLASALVLWAGVAHAQQAPVAPAAQPRPGAIGGRVVVAPGVPATACRLTLQGVSATTECKSGGGFMLKEVPPGQYELKISVTGVGDTSLSVGTGEDQTTYLGDVTVGVPGAVSGLVTADNTSDLDLTVIGIPALGLYTQPNISGYYVLSGVPGGTWNVTIFPPGQNSSARPVTAQPGQPIRGVDFQIKKPTMNMAPPIR
jgi:hypothetical protein